MLCVGNPEAKRALSQTIWSYATINGLLRIIIELRPSPNGASQPLATHWRPLKMAENLVLGELVLAGQPAMPGRLSII